MRRIAALALVTLAACGGGPFRPAPRGLAIATDATGTERRVWEWGIPACTVSMDEGGPAPTVYYRDTAGRIVRYDRWGQIQELRGFDAAGRWVVARRGDDVVTRVYDGRRLVAIETRTGKRMHHQRLRRDHSGRVIERVNNGFRETWSYDDHGRAVHQWTGRGKQRVAEWFWTWDDAGHLVNVRGLSVSSEGPVASHEYLTWEGDRLVATHHTIDAWPDWQLVKRFRYDATGRVIEVSEVNGHPLSTTRYTWDGDRPLEIRETLPDGRLARHVRFEYTATAIIRRDRGADGQEVVRTLEDTCPPQPAAERIRDFENTFVVDPLPRTMWPWLPDA